MKKPLSFDIFMVCIFLALGLTAMSLHSQPGPPRLVEKEGGFSYEPPPGWVAVSYPGMKFQVVTGTSENSPAPSINIVDDAVSDPLNKYASTIIGRNSTLAQNFHYIDQTPFTIRTGQINGIKITTEATQMGRRFKQTCYVFEHNKMKYVVTCCAAAQDADKMEPVFEHMVESFKFR